jgi:hypothetical protein
MYYKADSYVDGEVLGLEVKTDQEAFNIADVIVCSLYSHSRVSVNFTTLIGGF